MEILGAVKIKDGLFIGDEFAAQDLDFLVANKVTHIINCGANQIPNHWQQVGVQYLSFQWLDSDSQIIFDMKNQVVNDIFNFIQKALSACESVLVHSIKGQSRACSVVIAFLMKKFRWSLFKTLEFMNSRRPDLQIRNCFIQQLAALENRLVKAGLWLSHNQEYIYEELLLRNTYLNSLILTNTQKQQKLSQPLLKQTKALRITWSDNNTNDVKKLTNFSHFQSRNPIKNGFVIIKSCIKGAKTSETFIPIKYVSQALSQKLKIQEETSQIKNSISNQISNISTQNSSFATEENKKENLHSKNSINESNKQIKKVRPPSPIQISQVRNPTTQQTSIHQFLLLKQAQQQQVNLIQKYQAQQQSLQQQPQKQQSLSNQLSQFQYQNENRASIIQRLLDQNQKQESNNQQSEPQHNTSDYLNNIQQQSQLLRIKQRFKQEIEQQKKDQQKLQMQLKISSNSFQSYISSIEQSKQVTPNNQQQQSQPYTPIYIKKQQQSSEEFKSQKDQTKVTIQQDKNYDLPFKKEEAKQVSSLQSPKAKQSTISIQLQKNKSECQKDFAILQLPQQTEKDVVRTRPESAPRSARGESPQSQVQRQSQTPTKINGSQDHPLTSAQNNIASFLQRTLNGNQVNVQDKEQAKKAPIKSSKEIIQKHKQEKLQDNYNAIKEKFSSLLNGQLNTERKIIIKPQTSIIMRAQSPTPGIKSNSQLNFERKSRIEEFQNTNSKRSQSTSQSAILLSLMKERKSLVQLKKH